MNYKSCENCGVVVDFDVPALEHEDAYTHDQDRKCDSVVCPVCRVAVLSEEWEDV